MAPEPRGRFPLAGTFPGTANTQQHDINGQPLAGALLTVYQGGSTSALASTFQDIGLVLPASNPLVADASGRIPLFFVADGSYGLRLTDQFGIQTNGGFFYPQVPSIGASSSGGGGTPVDPTTVFSTGMWTWKPDASTMTGWVRINGRTIGNAVSGASELASAAAQALFIYMWTTFSQPTANAVCPVVGGIGANALADFNAGKQITLKDMRGRAPFGLDDMGSAALGAFTGVAFQNGNATTGGAQCGVNSTTLSLLQLPGGIASSTGAPVTVTSQATQKNIPVSSNGIASQPSPSSGGNFVPFESGSSSWTGVSSLSTGAAVTTTSTNTGGQAFPSVPSAMLGTHFWKL